MSEIVDFQGTCASPSHFPPLRRASHGARSIAVVAALSTVGIVVTPVSQAPSETAIIARIPLAPLKSIAEQRADLKVIARIRKLALLEDGWKGEDSKRPSDAAISDAEQFARAYFQNASVASPHVGAAPDGEINFYWAGDNVSIDLSILGDNTYTYFAHRPSGPPFFGDDVPLSESLPQELIKLLQSDL